MDTIRAQDRAYCLAVAFRLNAEADKLRRERNVQCVLWCAVAVVAMCLGLMWMP